MKAENGQEFYFSDGTVASTSSELLKKVMEMSKEEFKEYVNENKHDFHNWLNACVDKKAANAVKNSFDQKTIVEKLTGHHWEEEHKKKFSK